MIDNFWQLLLCCWVPYMGLGSFFFFKDDTLQRKKYWYVAPCVMFNLLCLLPPWIHCLLQRKWIIPTFQLNTKRLAKELLLCLALFEISFYYIHRTFHNIPFLYKHVHKVHHQLKKPIGFGALYAHPFEFVFCNLISMSIGPVLLQKPLLTTLQLWLCLGTSFIVATHSGHVPNKHLEHHITLRGEYGTLGFLDWLFHK